MFSLLEPRGQDVRDGPLALQGPCDVEVADEERVVSRLARRAAFREERGLGKLRLVLEVRAVEPSLGSRDDRAREGPGDRPQRGVRDRVLETARQNRYGKSAVFTRSPWTNA